MRRTAFGQTGIEGMDLSRDRTCGWQVIAQRREGLAVGGQRPWFCCSRANHSSHNNSSHKVTVQASLDAEQRHSCRGSAAGKGKIPHPPVAWLSLQLPPGVRNDKLGQDIEGRTAFDRTSMAEWQWQ